MKQPQVQAIRESGLSIDDLLALRKDMFIPAKELERILDTSLRGLNLDYPPRTRSKVVKQKELNQTSDIMMFGMPSSMAHCTAAQSTSTT